MRRGVRPAAGRSGGARSSSRSAASRRLEPAGDLGGERAFERGARRLSAGAVGRFGSERPDDIEDFELATAVAACIALGLRERPQPHERPL